MLLTCNHSPGKARIAHRRRSYYVRRPSQFSDGCVRAPGMLSGAMWISRVQFTRFISYGDSIIERRVGIPVWMVSSCEGARNVTLRWNLHIPHIPFNEWIISWWHYRMLRTVSSPRGGSFLSLVSLNYFLNGGKFIIRERNTPNRTPRRSADRMGKKRTRSPSRKHRKSNRNYAPKPTLYVVIYYKKFPMGGGGDWQLVGPFLSTMVDYIQRCSRDKDATQTFGLGT